MEFYLARGQAGVHCGLGAVTSHEHVTVTAGSGCVHLDHMFWWAGIVLFPVYHVAGYDIINHILTTQHLC